MFRPIDARSVNKSILWQTFPKRNPCLTFLKKFRSAMLKTVETPERSAGAGGWSGEAQGRAFRARPSADHRAGCADDATTAGFARIRRRLSVPRAGAGGWSGEAQGRAFRARPSADHRAGCADDATTAGFARIRRRLSVPRAVRARQPAVGSAPVRAQAPLQRRRRRERHRPPLRDRRRRIRRRLLANARPLISRRTRIRAAHAALLVAQTMRRHVLLNRPAHDKVSPSPIDRRSEIPARTHLFLHVHRRQRHRRQLAHAERSRVGAVARVVIEAERRHIRHETRRRTGRIANLAASRICLL